MDDRQWIADEALAVLDDYTSFTENGIKHVVTGHIYAKQEEWHSAGRPLLSPRARAILAAVEQEAKWCEMHCDDKDRCARNERDPSTGYAYHQVCLLAKIRRAYLGTTDAKPTTDPAVMGLTREEFEREANRYCEHLDDDGCRLPPAQECAHPEWDDCNRLADAPPPAPEKTCGTCAYYQPSEVSSHTGENQLHGRRCGGLQCGSPDWRSYTSREVPR